VAKIRVRHETPIIEYRLSHVPATACCPFHDDTNPSLSIKHTHYKCFACGESGDALRFVQRYQEIVLEKPVTFGQAVGMLQGMVKEQKPVSMLHTTAVHSSSSSSSRRSNSTSSPILNQVADTNRLFLAHAAAQNFFTDSLSRRESGSARQYIRNRPILSNPSTVQAFGIGFAPDAYRNWGDASLVQHLVRLGFSPHEIYSAGLGKLVQSALKRMQGSPNGTKETSCLDEISHANFVPPATFTESDLMDRFRDRITIPIWDHDGKNIIAFGGRHISTSALGPKYLNSPTTPVFTKSKCLFGLSRIQDLTTTPLVIVEGYMDVIALWSIGVGTAVSTMGTQITYRQLELAAQKTGEIVLCLDNDAAGLNAMERLCGKDDLLPCLTTKFENLQVSIATLPTHVKDPGELAETTKSPLRRFQDVLSNRTDWKLWNVQRIVSQNDKSLSSDTIQSVANFLSRCSERDQGIGDAAQILLESEQFANITDTQQFEDGLLHMVQSIRKKASHSEDPKQAVKQQQHPLIPVLDAQAKGFKQAVNEKQQHSLIPVLDTETKGLVRRKDFKQGQSEGFGIDFVHQSDRDWLDRRGALLLGKSKSKRKDKKNKYVYFEGETNSPIESKCFRPDLRASMKSHEEQLVTCMRQSELARQRIKSIYETRLALHPNSTITWSSPERGKEFHQLLTFSNCSFESVEPLTPKSKVDYDDLTAEEALYSLFRDSLALRLQDCGPELEEAAIPNVKQTIESLCFLTEKCDRIASSSRQERLLRERRERESVRYSELMSQLDEFETSEPPSSQQFSIMSNADDPGSDEGIDLASIEKEWATWNDDDQAVQPTTEQVVYGVRGDESQDDEDVNGITLDSISEEWVNWE